MVNKKIWTASAAVWLVLVALSGCQGETATSSDIGDATVTSAETASARAATVRLANDAPRLILFLVIDQARADYLVRFRPLLTGGLGRLLAESVVFTDAHHDHAYTATAPGHATLVTGRYPANHGIVANYWYDRELRQEIYSVLDDKDDKRTPQRLQASTFGDWLKAASPASRVFAASGKDRASVLTAGYQADAAFWFDKDDGYFARADYYSSPEYPWLDSFYAEHHPSRLFGQAWQPLPEVEQHGADYDIEIFDQGLVQFQFPQPLGRVGLTPDDSFFKSIYGSPFSDHYLGEFVKALITGENLGRGDAPDFVGVAFSALDAVGHTYGPNSPELMDTLLRLDRVLGELLDFVDQSIGLENVLISLSSDHGVTPVPELLRRRGSKTARRFRGEEVSCVQRAGQALREKFGDEEWVLSGFYFNRDLAAARGVSLTDLRNAVRAPLEACPGVTRVWTPEDLAAAPDDDLYARLYRHTRHPEHSPDVFLQLDPHTLTTRSSATNHGTPHAYDTAIPWLLRLPEGRHVQVDQRVHTVDVAPTLAALIGLAPEGEVDGVDRAALWD